MYPGSYEYNAAEAADHCHHGYPTGSCKACAKDESHRLFMRRDGNTTTGLRCYTPDESIAAARAGYKPISRHAWRLRVDNVINRDGEWFIYDASTVLGTESVKGGRIM